MNYRFHTLNLALRTELNYLLIKCKLVQNWQKINNLNKITIVLSSERPVQFVVPFGKTVLVTFSVFILVLFDTIFVFP